MGLSVSAKSQTSSALAKSVNPGWPMVSYSVLRQAGRGSTNTRPARGGCSSSTTNYTSRRWPSASSLWPRRYRSSPREYRDLIEVWPLRGNLRDIFQIGEDLRQATDFRLIVFDAKYRMAPAGTNENTNTDETRLYNALDRYAEMTGAAIVNVAHSSKGNQADKRVTDVGAGAGAQSRAADAHIILREHEDDGVVVLDGAVRSFAPPEPLPLRWTFPQWIPDATRDPTKLAAGSRLRNSDNAKKTPKASAK